jgi:hypothetical protein
MDEDGEVDDGGSDDSSYDWGGGGDLDSDSDWSDDDPEDLDGGNVGGGGGGADSKKATTVKKKKQKKKKKKKKKGKTKTQIKGEVNDRLRELGLYGGQGLTTEQFLERMPEKEVKAMLPGVIASLRAAFTDLALLKSELEAQAEAAAILQDSGLEDLFALFAAAVVEMHERDDMGHPVFDELSVMLHNM